MVNIVYYLYAVVFSSDLYPCTVHVVSCKKLYDVCSKKYISNKR